MEDDPLFLRFLTWLGGAHSKATVSSYRYGLMSLVKWLSEEGRKLPDCSLDDLSRYVLWLENRGLKPGTRALYVTSLKTMWQWMHRQNMVSFPETMIPTPPAVDKQSYPFLEPDEFRSLMEACGDFLPCEIRNQAVLSFLYATGLRLGEFLSLNVSDLDLENRKAVVKTFKRKNHKREVYWDVETHGYLTRWLDVRSQILSRAGLGCEALWISLDSAKEPCRVKRDAIQRKIRELRDKAGMEKKVTPHSFRHGFGYRGVRANANLRYLQVMMGHASLKTTTIYMGYKDSEVEDEYRRVMQVRGLHSLGRTGNIEPYAEKQTRTTGEKRTQRRDPRKVLERLHVEGFGAPLRAGLHHHRENSLSVRQATGGEKEPA